jgi:hypothetical protein
MRKQLGLTLGFGLAYLVLGTALFLRGVGAITLRWSQLGPVILILAGGAMVAGGILAEHLQRTQGGDLPAARGGWPVGGPDGSDAPVL